MPIVYKLWNSEAVIHIQIWLTHKRQSCVTHQTLLKAISSSFNTLPGNHLAQIYKLIGFMCFLLWSSSKFSLWVDTMGHPYSGIIVHSIFWVFLQNQCSCLSLCSLKSNAQCFRFSYSSSILRGTASTSEQFA